MLSIHFILKIVLGIFRGIQMKFRSIFFSFLKTWLYLSTSTGTLRFRFRFIFPASFRIIVVLCRLKHICSVDNFWTTKFIQWTEVVHWMDRWFIQWITLSNVLNNRVQNIPLQVLFAVAAGCTATVVSRISGLGEMHHYGCKSYFRS
jgi:hypothetical protein